MPTRDALAYYHNWYAEGLIDIEVFSPGFQPVHRQGLRRGSPSGHLCLVGNPRSGWVMTAPPDYAYLPVLKGPEGTYKVNLQETSTVGRQDFAVTSACESPEVLLNWVDQMYDPIISMQCSYGPIGVFFEEEPDENGVYVNAAPPEGMTEGELKSTNELLGPNAILNEYYGKYFYMEDRAQERCQDLNDFWFQYVDNTESFPAVVYSEEEIGIINDKLSGHQGPHRGARLSLAA